MTIQFLIRKESIAFRLNKRCPLITIAKAFANLKLLFKIATNNKRPAMTQGLYCTCNIQVFTRMIHISPSFFAILASDSQVINDDIQPPEVITHEISKLQSRQASRSDN